MRPISEGLSEADKVEQSGCKPTGVSGVKAQWRIVEPTKQDAPILKELFEPVMVALDRVIEEEKKKYKDAMKR